jgi:hypothetical protein
MVAACTNPAALAGGSAALHSYFSTDGRTIVSLAPASPWVVAQRPVETPWVSLPGLVTARCAANDHASYLEITVHGDPADPRTDDIRGDLGVGNQILTDWGLHLVDVDLGMGNLVDIVKQQSRAWTSRRR